MTANTSEAKTDSRAQRVLRTREDVFQDYTERSFLAPFEEYFAVEGSGGIDGMERTVFLLRKRVKSA